MISKLALAAALAAAGAASAAQLQQAPATEPPSQSAEVAGAAPAVAKVILPRGTMVRLMVLIEVNSRDNRPGDRFVVRVDEDVKQDGLTLIPIGAKGVGELVEAERTGGVGKSGRINARLLYVEASGRRIGLEGERRSAGSGSTGQVVASVVAFGPLGLLMKGNNASLKAGEIINGYTIADTEFDRPAGS